MKKHLLVFASLLPLVAVTAAVQFSTIPAALAAAANLPGEARSVAPFSAVSFASSGTVDIAVGKAQSLSIEANAALLSRITTEVRDGTLYIGRKNDNASHNDGPLTVHITLPGLDSVKLSGSGDIKIDGLNGGSTAVGISGSGNLSAKGALNKLELTISGSGKADLPDLTVKDAAVHISGSGDVKINAQDSLEATVSGSGDIRYMGSPRITSRVSGSGSIDRVR